MVNCLVTWWFRPRQNGGWPHFWPSTASDYVESVWVRAPESSDFRLKSIKNHAKALILQGFYGSGRRGRKFESCHLDHKSKQRGIASLFAFIVGYSSSAWLLLRNNASSHIPPEDLQARLQGAGRGYHGAKRSYLVTSTILALRSISQSYFLCLLHRIFWGLTVCFGHSLEDDEEGYPRILSCFLNCTVRLRHLKLLISSISTQSFHDGIFDPLHRCIRWEVFLNTLHWNFDFLLLVRLLVRLFFGQYRLYPFFGKNPCLTQLFHLNGLCERRCGFSFVDIIGKILLFLLIEI